MAAATTAERPGEVRAATARDVRVGDTFTARSATETPLWVEAVAVRERLSWIEFEVRTPEGRVADLSLEHSSTVTIRGSDAEPETAAWQVGCFHCVWRADFATENDADAAMFRHTRPGACRGGSNSKYGGWVHPNSAAVAEAVTRHEALAAEMMAEASTQ